MECREDLRTVRENGLVASHAATTLHNTTPLWEDKIALTLLLNAVLGQVRGHGLVVGAPF